MSILFNKNIILKDITGFDLKKTFECGQCFRFDAADGGAYEGVVGDRLLRLCDTPDGIEISGVTKEEFESFFFDYFDLGRDYAVIDGALANDPVLRDIIPFSTGIRILRQQPFETLVSFIISASNNIPRIKKIVAALCECFGTRHESEGRVYYSFPDAKTLAALDTADLAPIRAGFRDKYIIDCARKVADGTVDLEKIPQMSYADAAKTLMQINGVGQKVADCALLYGFGFLESFPKDVWIKRILKNLYGTETDAGLDFYGYGGIAQQYLFYYARENQINDIMVKD